MVETVSRTLEGFDSLVWVPACLVVWVDIMAGDLPGLWLVGM
jgi:hypothetical protein